VPVLTNGRVWTGTRSFDGHLVVTGDRVTEVGAGRYRGGGEVIDLDGACVLPAFGDGHAHPVFGALEDRGPVLKGAASVPEVVANVAGYAARHPDDTWIAGGGYHAALTPDGVFDAAWLDAAVPDRPVVLRANDYHTVWCNTEALRRAGITAGTPDPPLGRIVRRADGTPAGTLREWDACDLVLRLVPPRPPAELRQAATEASRYAASMGLTWVLDAWVDPESGVIDAYREASLRTRFDLALRADPRSWKDQLPAFADERRRSAGAELVRVETVKFFTDGVIEAGTGLLLEDYCDAPHERGMAVWEPDELRAAVTAFDAAGFRVHLHAIGDGAVRLALDAIEEACRTNPPWDRRPVIAHVQLVDRADLPRFAALGVIANVEPYWAQPDDIQTRLTIPRLGPARSAAQYPMAGLLSVGARLSFGSDWPVTTMNPLAGLAVAVRRDWLPDHHLTVPQALRIMTAGAAYQARAESTRGTLTAGAIADLVWLSADPTRTPPADLAAIEIRGTWLAGRRTA
jgi:predicted amidohydrolase YtcJ